MRKTEATSQGHRRSRREFIGGFVVVLIVGGVLVSRSSGPRQLQAKPLVTLQPVETVTPAKASRPTTHEARPSAAR